MVRKSEQMNLNRKEQYITLEGKTYSAADIARLSASVTTQTPPMLAELYAFLEAWFDDSPTMRVHTSGSTGTPKELIVRKEQMMQSARLTCEVFKLAKGDTALLCMPLRYIAGKMMVVRALVGELNLIVRTPSGHPLADVKEKIRFAAMVPLQVYNTLDTPKELKRLRRIDTLIIGGGPVTTQAWHKICQLPGEVYSTYGMTETLSHVALCRLNSDTSDSLTYHPLPGVKFSISPDHTLVIEAPLICDEALTTNDVATLAPEGGFLILGRRDNTINSGGIKLQPEILEAWLQFVLPMPFVFTSVPHERLGEAVVLLVEGILEIEKIRVLVEANMPKHYRCGKYIIPVRQIPLTGNGKVDRVACRELARSMFRTNVQES